MKLQLALDFITAQEAKELLKEVQDYIDIVEIGTPFVIQEGIRIVREIKHEFPSLELLADLKIMDAGEHEAKMGFDAGADIVTVLGLAYDTTIRASVEQARIFKKRIMIDMIGIKDIKKRSAQLDNLGVDYICIHTAFDIQEEGKNPLVKIREVRSVLKKAKVAVAGGIKLNNIADVIKEQPDIVIVGGGITGQPNNSQIAYEIKKALENNREI